MPAARSLHAGRSVRVTQSVRKLRPVGPAGHAPVEHLPLCADDGLHEDGVQDACAQSARSAHPEAEPLPVWSRSREGIRRQPPHRRRTQEQGGCQQRAQSAVHVALRVCLAAQAPEAEAAGSACSVGQLQPCDRGAPALWVQRAHLTPMATARENENLCDGGRGQPGCRLYAATRAGTAAATAAHRGVVLWVPPEGRVELPARRYW